MLNKINLCESLKKLKQKCNFLILYSINFPIFYFGSFTFLSFINKPKNNKDFIFKSIELY